VFISQSRRFIFIHVPKTAGESVTSLFDETSLWNDLPIGGTPFGETVNRHYQQRHSLHKHSTSQEVLSVLGAKVWNQYFTFTFTRHPYTRILSLYNYADRLLNNQRSAYLRRLPRKGRRKHDLWSWPAIQASVASRSFSELIRHPKFLADRASLPQTTWIQDESGEEIIDFVGRVEAIETDLSTVVDRVGLPQPEVQRKNKSPGRQGKRHYPTEEDYRLLADLYRKDFDYFGYDPDWRIQHS
jgi:hypothetical protein